MERIRCIFAVTLLVAGVLASWMFLGPSQVGGPVTYVTTQGISMEPLFHQGDLALVRETGGRLQVGDIALYRSHLTHQTVLHRVVATDGDLYVFKGDNNSWIDTYHPSDADIVGKLWFHVENAGKGFEWMRNPIHGGLLGGLVAVVTVGGVAGGTSGRGRIRPKSRGFGRVDLPLLALGPKGQWLLGLFLALLAVSAVTAMASYRAPTLQTTTTQLKFQSQGQFNYTAPISGPASIVYDGSVLLTGQPIYVHLIPSVTYRFDLTFVSSQAHNVVGTIRLVGVVADVNGFRKSIDLTPPTPFEGDTATITTTIELAPMMGLLQQIEGASGSVARYYTAAIVADVHIRGSIDGLALTQDFEPRVVMRILLPDQIYVETPETRILDKLPGLATATGDIVQQDAYHSVKDGSVAKAISSDNEFSIWRFTIPVRRLRTVSIMGGALGVLGGIVLVFLMALGMRRSESRRIFARYGGGMVSVSDVQLATNTHLVNVATFDELVRLAEQYGRPILWHDEGGPDTYYVQEGGTVYRHHLRLPAEPADAAP
jgi:signal peptidase I